MATTKTSVRIAATADLHCTVTSQGTFQRLFSSLSDNADVLLLCGDLTDHGLAEEARALARELSPMTKLPIVSVLGNHDYESGQQTEIHQILTDAGIHVLDGGSYETQGIGFAGIKGFAGGFGPGALGPWGEEAIKRFVHEAIAEALKLESALARLRTIKRVALLHYSPVRETVQGEPPEIFAYLGSSRLEEPLNRFSVNTVFHGHAHHGSPEGRTSSNIPVYNVSMKLLQRTYPDRPPLRMVEIPLEPQPPSPIIALPL